MSVDIYEIAKEYVEFMVNGKRVNIPYSMVKYPGEKYNPKLVTRTTLEKHFAAKGTPEQIRSTLVTSAQQCRFDLYHASSQAIHQFMLDQGIGIDCSGFVYQVLNRYLKQKYHKSLDTLVSRYPGLKGKIDLLLFPRNRVRKISAKNLTSDFNTIEVKKVKDIQAGDMIRLTDPHWHGKHIAIILKVLKNELTYAHASERTTLVGPHFATIKITHPDAGLENQTWLEKLQDGTSYKTTAFHPERGDSVRRVKGI
jgi:hypothetical protein